MHKTCETALCSANRLLPQVNHLCIVAFHQRYQLSIVYVAIKPLSGGLTKDGATNSKTCLLYTSPSPRDATLSRMPSSA